MVFGIKTSESKSDIKVNYMLSCLYYGEVEQEEDPPESYPEAMEFLKSDDSDAYDTDFEVAAQIKMDNYFIRQINYDLFLAAYGNLVDAISANFRLQNEGYTRTHYRGNYSELLKYCGLTDESVLDHALFYKRCLEESDMAIHNKLQNLLDSYEDPVIFIKFLFDSNNQTW